MHSEECNKQEQLDEEEGASSMGLAEEDIPAAERSAQLRAHPARTEEDCEGQRNNSGWAVTEHTSAAAVAGYSSDRSRYCPYLPVRSAPAVWVYSGWIYYDQ